MAYSNLEALVTAYKQQNRELVIELIPATIKETNLTRVSLIAYLYFTYGKNLDD